MPLHLICPHLLSRWCCTGGRLAASHQPEQDDQISRHCEERPEGSCGQGKRDPDGCCGNPASKESRILGRKENFRGHSPEERVSSDQRWG